MNPSRLSSIRCIVVGLTLLLGGAAAFAADALPDPAKPGPFPVGVTTTTLVDPSRTDSYTNAPRTLVTEIWYPATDDSRSLPKTTLKSYYLDGKNPQIIGALKLAFKIDLLEVDKTFPDLAVRDARVRDGVFPLLVFSHGNGGMRSQSVFWCEQLASHGYIVVSPDHTGNCAITAIDGKTIIYNEKGREQAATDRPKDVSFLIDAMTRMNQGGDSRFAGKVDLEHIGVAGHSFGGYTATAVADTDPRVKAIAPMAAVFSKRTKFDCPAMLILATEDRTIKAEGNEQIRKYYAESKGPRYLVEFKNAGHFSFSGMFYFNPTFGDGIGTGKRITNGEDITYAPMDVVYSMTNGYTTAFFGKFLKGQNGYDAYLNANHNPQELIVKWGADDAAK